MKDSPIDKIEQSVGLSKQIMTLRIFHAGGKHLRVISVYVPTLAACEEANTAFYQAFGKLLRAF